MERVSSFEEILEQDGFLTYKVRGVSMEPMLRQGRDIVTIRRREPGERFAENDVVLYYRKGDRMHTLHRIVGLVDGGYVILGDNCHVREVGIPDGDVLGVVVSFVRDGRETSVDDPEYLAYVRDLRAGEERRIASRRRRQRAKALVKRLIRYDRWKGLLRRG